MTATDSETLIARNWVKTKQVADHFDVSYQTVRNWTDRGILPQPIRSGSWLLYDFDAVKAVDIKAATLARMVEKGLRRRMAQ